MTYAEGRKLRCDTIDNTLLRDAVLREIELGATTLYAISEHVYGRRQGTTRISEALGMGSRPAARISLTLGAKICAAIDYAPVDVGL